MRERREDAAATGACLLTTTPSLVSSATPREISCAGSNGEEYQRPDGPDDDNTEADPLAVGAAICAAGDVHDVTAEKESKEVAEDIEEDTGNDRGSLAKFSFRHDRYHEAGERRNYRAGTMHHKEQRT